jgi:hypothetical protein
MTIAFVQQAAGNTGGLSANSVGLTWGTATKTGGFLVAQLDCIADPGALTGPTGWTNLRSKVSLTNKLWKSYWVKINAASETTPSWSLSNFVQALVTAREYSGILTASPQDGSTIDNTDSGTTISPSNMTTALPNELILWGVSQIGASAVPIFSGFTGTGSLLPGQADTNTKVNQSWFQALVSTATTYAASCSSDNNNDWVSISAAFKATLTPPNPQPIRPWQDDTLGYLLEDL